MGALIRSLYVPVFAILCSLTEPLNASLAEVDYAVVCVVSRDPGAEGIVGLFDKSSYDPDVATVARVITSDEEPFFVFVIFFVLEL